MKEILKGKAFWITLSIVVVIILLALWLRQYECKNGQYPWQNKTLPAIARGKCSFWTGKPILVELPASTRQTSVDCCRDAEGRSCYPCLSIACCDAGFRAGYSENRDVIQRQKK